MGTPVLWRLEHHFRLNVSAACRFVPIARYGGVTTSSTSDRNPVLNSWCRYSRTWLLLFAVDQRARRSARRRASCISVISGHQCFGRCRGAGFYFLLIPPCDYERGNTNTVVVISNKRVVSSFLRVSATFLFPYPSLSLSLVACRVQVGVRLIVGGHIANQHVKLCHESQPKQVTHVRFIEISRQHDAPCVVYTTTCSQPANFTSNGARIGAGGPPMVPPTKCRQQCANHASMPRPAAPQRGLFIVRRRG